MVSSPDSGSWGGKGHKGMATIACHLPFRLRFWTRWQHCVLLRHDYRVKACLLVFVSTLANALHCGCLDVTWGEVACQKIQGPSSPWWPYCSQNLALTLGILCVLSLTVVIPMDQEDHHVKVWSPWHALIFTDDPTVFRIIQSVNVVCPWESAIALICYRKK